MSDKPLPAKGRQVGVPDPIDVHVGKRLRLRRNLAAMSQEQLGRASGLTFQQIQKYERGVNRMGASRLFQIGRLLDVPVAYFFEEMPADSRPGFSDPAQAPLEGKADPLQKRETMELIRAWYR